MPVAAGPWFLENNVISFFFFIIFIDISVLCECLVFVSFFFLIEFSNFIRAKRRQFFFCIYDYLLRKKNNNNIGMNYPNQLTISHRQTQFANKQQFIYLALRSTLGSGMSLADLLQTKELKFKAHEAIKTNKTE